MNQKNLMMVVGGLAVVGIVMYLVKNATKTATAVAARPVAADQTTQQISATGQAISDILSAFPTATNMEGADFGQLG